MNHEKEIALNVSCIGVPSVDVLSNVEYADFCSKLLNAIIQICNKTTEPKNE